MSARYHAKGIKIIVLDPLFNSDWFADVLIDDPGRFLDICQASRSCAIFIDESAEFVGRYDTEMHWLATRGRHFGHSLHFISQRGISIAKTVRHQCERLILFKTAYSDCKEHCKEWCDDRIMNAQYLKRGEFIAAIRHDGVYKGNTYR